MSPLLYLVIGLIGGGLIVAVVVLLTRRGNQGAATDMAKRLEVIDRGLRDEFSRNREEAGAAAKNQREELTRSLEGVRSAVDVRLRQLQEDNAKQIDKMRATVDEKLQGTLEKRLGESFKLVSDRCEISDGTLRAPHSRAGKWRPCGSRSGDQNVGDPFEAVRQRYLREIHQPAKDNGFCAHVSAKRRTLRGSDSSDRPRAKCAARLPGHVCRADYAGCVAQQFADGFSHAHDPEALERSLEL